MSVGVRIKSRGQQAAEGKAGDQQISYVGVSEIATTCSLVSWLVCV